MIASIVISLFVLIIAFIGGNTNHVNRSLLLSFSIIFLFLALRYDFGNDYMNYYNYFDEVHRLSLRDMFSIETIRNPAILEPGYTWINRLVPHFFVLLAILALFTVYTYYKYMSLYLQPSVIWFALFIYLFSPSLMLVHSSAIRQSIAICFFIFSIQYLIERSFLKFLLIILLASLFHRSALVLIPLYFIATPKIWSRQILFLIVGLYIFTAFFGYLFLGAIEKVAQMALPSYYRTYLINAEANSLDTGFGFLFKSMFLFLILWSHDRSSPQLAVITKLAIIGFLLLPLSIYLLVFSRLMMYFNVALIIAIPYAVFLQKSKQLRIVLISIISFWYLYEYANFFQDPTWVEHFSHYKINLIHGL